MLTKPGSDNKPYSSDSVYHAFTGGREAGATGALHQSGPHFAPPRGGNQRPRRSPALSRPTSLAKSSPPVAPRFLKQRISFIFGDSQIGKSISLDEYARLHNHGETKLITIPTRPSFTSLLGEFAIRLGISTQNRTEDLKRRIMECFR
jgi:hypothetical protein